MTLILLSVTGRALAVLVALNGESIKSVLEYRKSCGCWCVQW